MCILERFFIDFCKHLLISEICGGFPLLLEIYSPTDSTDFHRCILRLFSHRFHRFSQILYISASVFIFYICVSHPLHLEIILPQIPQIFTDFIYPRIRAPLCYLWEILSHPISVLICDICGSPLCCLRLFSHRLHRFYISQYPCSSLLSVGNTFAPNICVYLCYMWEIPSHDDGSSYSFIDSEMRPLR